MKEKMDEASKLALVEYRIQKHFPRCLKSGIVGIMMILFIVMRRW